MHPQRVESSIISYEKKLVAEFTGVKESDVKVNDVGWTSRVYIVGNGSWVFKFPRNEKTKQEYEHERAVLELLKDLNSNIQVPRIQWTDPGNNYLGYEGIIGQTFDQVHIPNDKMRSIGKSVGEFLKQLHALRLLGARNVSIKHEIKELHDKYALISRAAGLFSPEELKKLESTVFKSIPSDLERLGLDYGLCHGDLGYWNLILKNDGSVGVIDFGDIGNWDRSKDFIGLENEEILNEALNAYGDNDLIRQKIAVRRKILVIMDLCYFTDVQNKKGVQKSLTKIRAFL